MKKLSRQSFLLSTLLGLAALPVGTHAAEQHQAEGNQYPDVMLELEEIGGGFFRIGQFVQASMLADVTNGTSGRAVTEILGTPVAVTREGSQQFWYYDINLPLTEGNHQLVCQYRVEVSPALLVSGTEWRREQCRVLYDNFMDNHIVYQFPADILFDFDSAELDAAGRQVVDEVGEMIMSRRGPSTIHVTGHTDHLGRPEYNQQLSEDRANAVSDQLSMVGVPESWITTEGIGAQSPIVLCPGTVSSPTLISCLAPNRRVRVEVADQ